MHFSTALKTLIHSQIFSKKKTWHKHKITISFLLIHYILGQKSSISRIIIDKDKYTNIFLLPLKLFFGIKFYKAFWLKISLYLEVSCLFRSYFIALRIELLIVCNNDLNYESFSFYFFVSKNDRFVFGKLSFLKTSFWTFKERKTIVFENDRFFKSDIFFNKNDRFFKQKTIVFEN